MKYFLYKIVIAASLILAGQFAGAAGLASNQMINTPIVQTTPTIKVPQLSSQFSNINISKTIITRPIISVVKPGCLYPGKSNIIYGSNFGSAKKYRVALVAGGISFTVQMRNWSDTKLSVSIPVNMKLQPKVSYRFVIEDSAKAEQISNLSQSLQVCSLMTGNPITVMAAKSIDNAKATPAAAPSNQADDQRQTGSIPSGSSNQELQGNIQLPSPPQVPKSQTSDEHDRVPHEILVLSETMAKAEIIRKALSSYGIRVTRRSRLSGLGLVISVLHLPDNISVKAALHQLRARYQSTWIDGNNLYHLQGESDLGHDKKQYGRYIVKWPQVSGCGKPGRIGIIDSSIDIMIPALARQRIMQKSFLEQGINPSPQEHGTAIASLLVGHDSAQNINGLLSGAQIFAAGVFRKNTDDSVDATTELIVRGLDWLVKHHVSVINLSLGGKRNLILEAAIERILADDIAVVAAAGNSGPGGSPEFPAAQKGVISVTAVDINKQIFSKSNRGDYISVAAPGVDVWSAATNGKGHYYSGTSYAVPFVTAYFALRGKYTLARTEKKLQKMALDLGSKGYDKVYGWGLLQANALCIHH